MRDRGLVNRGSGGRLARCPCRVRSQYPRGGVVHRLAALSQAVVGEPESLRQRGQGLGPHQIVELQGPPSRRACSMPVRIDPLRAQPAESPRHAEKKGPTSPSTEESGSRAAQELFDMVRQLLARMNGPKTQAQIADEPGVDKAQARKWLERLVKEGRLEKPEPWPVREAGAGRVRRTARHQPACPGPRGVRCPVRPRGLQPRPVATGGFQRRARGPSTVTRSFSAASSQQRRGRTAWAALTLIAIGDDFDSARLTERDLVRRASARLRT